MSKKEQAVARVAAIRRSNTEARHAKVVSRVHLLFNVKRRRIDDVFPRVATEFGLAASTVEKIYLKSIRQTKAATQKVAA